MNYRHGIINDSLAIWEDADGFGWKIILLTPECNSFWIFRVVVGQESGAIVGSRLLKEPSL